MTDEKKEIKYFFITEFQWKLPFIAEKFGGHPFEGRVYRGEYNDRTKVLRLFIDGMNKGVDFDTMIAKGPSDPWNGQIDHLTTANAAQFNILEEDLVTLEKWIDTDNADLFQPVYIPYPPPFLPIIQPRMDNAQIPKLNHSLVINELNVVFFQTQQLIQREHLETKQFRSTAVEEVFVAILMVTGLVYDSGFRELGSQHREEVLCHSNFVEHSRLIRLLIEAGDRITVHDVPVQDDDADIASLQLIERDGKRFVVLVRKVDVG